MKREDLRNIAIIAHVDHGKTTLVDQMLKQGGIYRKNQVIEERVMDSGDLEKERGITILAKNTSVFYEDTKINIVDTPGHADFSGEVERVLNMVNGSILLVDAAEGPMPQTRFVLSKALAMKMPIIIVINKTDRPDARISEVIDEILTLLIDLDADESQLDCPIVYCSGRNGTASLSDSGQGEDLRDLFETIIKYIPAPDGDTEKPLQMLVSSIDYNEYVGRIAVGRVERGIIEQNSEVLICSSLHSSIYKAKAANIYQIDGLKRTPAESASAGDIICVSGISEITIGDTICCTENAEPLPFSEISEPTVEMTFSVNDSPLAGREGRFVTSRQLRERLYRELLKDVSLRVADGDSADYFVVSGRGEMHLSVLIETMRREGYEFAVSKPKALFRIIDGKRHEPAERLVLDVPKDYSGSVIEKLSSRRGELQNMNPMGDRMRIEYHIPSRGLLGYRGEFLTDTRGEGVMSAVFLEYQPYKGEIPSSRTGSLIASEAGDAVTYGLYNAQERGALFVSPGDEIYEGMIVGISPKQEDIVINVCKRKHVTNIRAAGSDDALRLVPPLKYSLEEYLEFIGEDELLEVTPKCLRLRKKLLNKNERMRFENKNRQAGT